MRVPCEVNGIKWSDIAGLHRFNNSKDRSIKVKLSILPKNIVDTQVVEFDTLKELCDLICNNDYSGILFKNNYRRQDNFISSEFIILDFDNNPSDPKLSLIEAIQTFSEYKCIISTSRNHQRPKDDKPKADRFRVILFTEQPITNLKDYLTTWLSVAKRYPATDQKCKDGARFFYSSQEVRHCNEHGKLIPIVKAAEVTPTTSGLARTYSAEDRGELSYNTQKFLTNGAPSGSWNSTLYLAAKDFQEQLYTMDECIAELEKIDGYLDSSSLSTIRSAYKNEPKYPPRFRPTDMPTVEVWARSWLKDNAVTMSYKTGALTFNGVSKNIKYIISRMVLDAKHWAENNPIVNDEGKQKQRMPYSQDALEHVFNIWEEEQRNAVVSEMRSLLEFNSAARTTSIEEWLRAVTGKVDGLDLAVMRHFIWQVKRKLTGQRVDWHIMPIFYGPSGSGKSRALESLFQVIDEIVIAPGDLTVLEDTRNAHIFGKFFVVFFDEMSKAEKVNIEALKNKITSSTVSYRILGTNSTVNETNTSTFIGASNRSVMDIIYDPTSARRFWQIDTLQKCDFEAVNSINYLEVWQSVDEAAESPLLPVIEQVMQIQRDELRVKSPVELWLDDYRKVDTKQVGVNSDTPTTENLLSVSFLYDQYKDWGENQKFKHFVTLNKFSRELNELGLTKVRKESGVFYDVTPKRPTAATVIPFRKD